MVTRILSKRLLPAVSALMLCSYQVSAEQAAAPQEFVKTELRAFLGELSAALAARDRAAFERLYADEFLFVHALGAPVNKADQITGAMSTPPRGGSVPIPSLDDLLVFGDVAILRTPVDGRFGTSIYVRRNGRWQVLQIQGTPTPSTRPAAAVSSRRSPRSRRPVSAGQRSFREHCFRSEFARPAGRRTPEADDVR